MCFDASEISGMSCEACQCRNNGHDPGQRTHPHGTGYNLKLSLILGRECDQHHEETHEQAHQIGEGDKHP